MGREEREKRDPCRVCELLQEGPCPLCPPGGLFMKTTNCSSHTLHCFSSGCRTAACPGLDVHDQQGLCQPGAGSVQVLREGSLCLLVSEHLAQAWDAALCAFSQIGTRHKADLAHLPRIGLRVAKDSCEQSQDGKHMPPEGQAGRWTLQGRGEGGSIPRPGLRGCAGFGFHPWPWNRTWFGQSVGKGIPRPPNEYQATQAKVGVQQKPASGCVSTGQRWKCGRGA